jgi:hypothetical protein
MKLKRKEMMMTYEIVAIVKDAPKMMLIANNGIAMNTVIKLIEIRYFLIIGSFSIWLRW